VRAEVIIVKYGCPELEAECVASVIEHTKDVDYHLTIRDNWEADDNLTKVWNDCIRDTNAEYICLLDGDTRVEAKWLSKLLKCFAAEEKIGAAGPKTNANADFLGTRLRSGPQAKPRKNIEGFIVTGSPLIGFCLVFPRFLWEEIGGFDERYALGSGDSDFCKAIQKIGYKLVIRTDVLVYHHGQAGTSAGKARGKDIDKLQKAGRKLYAEKWKGK
jgi:GT2 family glycosyltransferase